MAVKPAEPRLRRSAPDRVIQSRSIVPATFSSVTPSLRATATASLTISSPSLRARRDRISAPSRFPAIVPSDEILGHRYRPDGFEKPGQSAHCPVGGAAQASDGESPGRGAVVDSGAGHGRPPSHDGTNNAVITSDPGNALLAQTILKHHHVAVFGQVGKRGPRRLLDRGWLRCEQDKIIGVPVRYADRDASADRAHLAVAPQAKAVLSHRLSDLFIGGHRGHVGSDLGEVTRDNAADATATHD